jgi:hypothetical protein
MVKMLLLSFVLFQADALAVWQNDLFGEPPPAYYSRAYTKLLEWTMEKYAGNQALSGEGRRFLQLCAKEASAWYHPKSGAHRQPSFAVRLGYDPASLRKIISVRCLPLAPAPELMVLMENILRSETSLNATARSKLRNGKILGFEFTFGRKKLRVIEEGRELLFENKKPAGVHTFQAYKEGSNVSGFPLPWLVQSSGEVTRLNAKTGFRIELRAYMDGIAPPELRQDIEALHREFGLLADSIFFVSGEPSEIFFP